ncbi:Gldg family protein [Candidatus Leptofilum sp.]|uniref:Gldg family protein n=1 Tax=Candidatus Leptofilum sp. TaxID=3241576 RepID=UPI003B5C536E
MSNVWQVARRELSALFVQPLAYVFGVVLLGLTGYVFASELFILATQPGALPLDVQSLLGLFRFLYLFAMPALTMRLLAEEQRSGTLELLLALPLRDGEVVLGKFLAGLLFYLLTAVLTLIFPLILFIFGNPDPGPIWTAYLGAVLYGAALIGIGLLASAWTENQIVAFIVALGMSLLLYLLLIPAQSFALGEPASTILNELALINHQDNLSRGVLLVKDIVYFVGVTAVFLLAATLVLKSKRGRQTAGDWWQLVGATAVFTLLYVIAYQNPNWRYDATANNAFTPLPETVELLQRLNEPIHVLGFYTAETAFQRSETENSLQTMQAYTDQLSYEFVDPNENPLLAEQYDLTFSGTLVFTREDGRFAKASTLTDRDLHTALVRTLNPTVKTAYFLTGHGERDWQDFGVEGIGTAVTLLQESGFTIQSLNLFVEGEIPADANVVFLIDQQAPLAAAELDALHHYVERGGALFLARDAVDTEGRVAAEEDGLLNWLQTSWGITLRNDLIIDASLAQAGQTIGLTFVGAQYGSSPITQDLEQFGTIFNVARSISTELPPGITAVNLITTSELAWGETNFERMIAAGEVAPNEEDATGSLTVALSALNTASGARLVLFGDTDFLSNSFIQQGGNSFLFENAANWLVDDVVSIQLSARESIPRQVTITQSQLTLLQLVSIFLMPGLLALVGGWVWYSRQQRG